MDGVGGVDAVFAGFVEHGSDAGEFVGGVDAVAQRVGGGDGDAGGAGALVAGVEVLAGEWRGEESAECFAAASFRSDRGAQGVDFAVAGEQSGVAAFVAGAGPGFAAGLAGEGADGALVVEAVAVFVGALAAGVVAVQAGSAGTADRRGTRWRTRNRPDVLGGVG